MEISTHKKNPADEGTRDVVSANLDPDSVWFYGPTSLGNSSEFWPTEKMKMDKMNLADLEVKKDHVCLMILMQIDLLEVTIYSSWWRLIRVTAWFGRKSVRKTGPLKALEIQDAE